MGWIVGRLVLVPVSVMQVLHVEGLYGPEWGAVGSSGGFEVVPVGWAWPGCESEALLGVPGVSAWLGWRLVSLPLMHMIEVACSGGRAQVIGGCRSCPWSEWLLSP